MAFPRRTRRAVPPGRRGGSGRPAGGAPDAAAAAKAAPRSPRGARAQKSAERRAAILSAALDEFAAQGFAAARLDDVARRAGVAKGTIYLHFRDKEALFQELIRSVLGPLVASLEAAPLADLPFRVVAEQLMNRFIHEIYASPRKDILRLVIAEGGRFPQIAEFYYREVLERVLMMVRRLAQRAVERGELADDALVRFPQLMGAPAVVAIVWSTLFERLAPLDIEAFMQAHLDLLFGKRRGA
jgi:AcrR family transcriptional regulator